MSVVSASGTLVGHDPQTFNLTRTPGTFGSGQNFIAYTPDAGPAFPPVVLCHAASGNGTSFDSGSARQIINQLVGSGFCCIASDMHGDSWGNNNAIVDIDDGIDWLDANSPADPSEGVILLGLSMGWTAASAWVNANPDRAISMLSLVGACSLEYCHDNNPTFETQIDTAYGGHSGYIAALPTHDPTAIAADSGLDGIPIAMWYGSSDTTVGADESAHFADITAALWVQDVIAHLGIGLMNPTDAASFVVAHYPPALANRTLVTI